ncbi:Outer membrane protein (porin) [Jannaschia seosinensis]|uniref:Outer membrane protein (Porin) n=1 Tax=Jannaschia seosinensis TaxID=313367 RepID=A0A0M7BAN6_9RHOB|nr:porin [Jannaschia seosinensis]CUH39800.1 Outer membrane protein (porin) [Jannaschia seosinensis]
MRTALLALPFLALSTCGALAKESLSREFGGATATFSGQISYGLLRTDDGEEENAFFVDNDNSSTRFRLRIERELSGGTTLGVIWVFEPQYNSSAAVDQRDRWVGDEAANRRLQIRATHPGWGELSVGKGDTATEDAAQQDLSATSLAGFSDVDALSGGMVFRDGDGALSEVTVGAAYTNLDGLGRRERLLYVSPSRGGITLRTSFGGAEDFFDIALRYEGAAGEFDLAGGVGWFREARGDDGLTGSISALHRATGISVTAAAGSQDRQAAPDIRTRYLKLGWQDEGIMPLGLTAISLDWGRSDDVLQAGDAVTAYGFQAVQVVERINTDLYLGYCRHDLDRANETFQDVDSMQMGARFRF